MAAEAWGTMRAFGEPRNRPELSCHACHVLCNVRSREQWYSCLTGVSSYALGLFTRALNANCRTLPALHIWQIWAPLAVSNLINTKMVLLCVTRMWLFRPDYVSCGTSAQVLSTQSSTLKLLVRRPHKQMFNATCRFLKYPIIVESLTVWPIPYIQMGFSLCVPFTTSPFLSNLKDLASSQANKYSPLSWSRTKFYSLTSDCVSDISG